MFVGERDPIAGTAHFEYQPAKLFAMESWQFESCGCYRDMMGKP
jgi:hypothetical protein